MVYMVVRRGCTVPAVDDFSVLGTPVCGADSDIARADGQSGCEEAAAAAGAGAGRRGSVLRTQHTAQAAILLRFS